MPFRPPPPSRLYLMRHAQSGWALPGQTDFDRTLDETGLADAADVAHRAAEAGFRPALVLCSTAKRCRETAAALTRAFGEDLRVVFSDDLYNAPPSAYFDLIGQHAGHDSVLILGHNPAMEEILETLAGLQAASEVAPDGYPTAGFAVLSHIGHSTDDAWALDAFLKR